MNPVSPRLGVSIGEELVIAKEQPPYLPLIAHLYGPACEGSPVVTRWRLSWRERLAVLIGRDLFVQILSFGHPFPPIHLTFNREQVRYLTLQEFEAVLKRRTRKRNPA